MKKTHRRTHRTCKLRVAVYFAYLTVCNQPILQPVPPQDENLTNLKTFPQCRKNIMIFNRILAKTKFSPYLLIGHMTVQLIFSLVLQGKNMQWS